MGIYGILRLPFFVLIEYDKHFDISITYTHCLHSLGTGHSLSATFYEKIFLMCRHYECNSYFVLHNASLMGTNTSGSITERIYVYHVHNSVRDG
jgi:hypothetical protein